jgi:hypothetical protein
MKKILVLLLAAGTFHAFAQKMGKPEAFAKTITPDDLKKQLAIVASADMEGRETATEPISTRPFHPSGNR